MKMALLIFPLLSALSAAFSTFGQGTVFFNNTFSTLVSTNAAGVGGGSGLTASSSVDSNGFYYALFTASSTISSLSPSAQELLTPTWTFTGLYATNIAATAGGRFSGGVVPTLTGWPPQQTNSFVVAGWSAALGHDWSSLAPQLSGASFANGIWIGGNWSVGSLGGFFGLSSVSFGAAGGGTNFIPAFTLFGSVPNFQGNPISTGFNLFVVTAPEPSPAFLAGAGLLLLIFIRTQRPSI